MPGISDPGSDLVCLARENDIPFTLLPGPSAALSALLLSGMDSSRFVFEGFLPRDKKSRRARMQALKCEQRTVIIYEAPHRLITTLEELYEELGNGKIAVAREMTKLFEEVFVCDLNEAIDRFKARTPKGEIVIVLQGANMEEKDAFLNVPVKKHIESYINAGLDKKEAIKQVALDRKIPKSQVYKHTIDEEG
jgi:16S rRNA (cytidine1402-2'-O)-methyltransferase